RPARFRRSGGRFPGRGEDFREERYEQGEGHSLVHCRAGPRRGARTASFSTRILFTWILFLPGYLLTIWSLVLSGSFYYLAGRGCPLAGPGVGRAAHCPRHTGTRARLRPFVTGRDTGARRADAAAPHRTSTRLTGAPCPPGGPTDT